MANQSETGHAKNVANFSTLITVVNSFGAVYNPSKQAITPGALAAQAGNATNVMNLLNGALGQSDIAIAARVVAFEPMSKLATRILNALRASDVTDQIVDAAQSLVRKIQGKRATPKKTDEEKAALLAEGTSIKEVSSSQMSFDNRLDSFDKLIQLLSSIPQYAPNEEELKITTLTNYYNTLKSTNAAAIEAETRLSNARLSRNEILHKTDSGLVDIAASVKIYVKSLFGATSAQYKQISGLAFKSEKV
ncbi:MAG: hypothetical protein Q8N05_18245 [Bacteroidota bacterium]|nr:hypothetical protein [Bacteroidota bacterium]